MFIQIAPKVKVYVTDSQLRFIKKYSKLTFKNTDLLPTDFNKVLKNLYSKMRTTLIYVGCTKNLNIMM